MDQRIDSPIPASLLEGVIEQFLPVRVILFGSRARGDAGPDSDIDLLVVVEDDLPPERRGWEAVKAARARYRGVVDILPWRRSTYDAERGVVGSLPWTADREGIVVYGSKVEPLSGDPAGVRVKLAAQWLAKADKDLLTAKVCLREGSSLVENAGYHCQQCAEKLIKGCLILAEVPFRKTHDLAELIRLLPNGFLDEIREAMTRVQDLTSWAFAGRYPTGISANEPAPPTLPAVQAALRDLEALRALVARAIDSA